MSKKQDFIRSEQSRDKHPEKRSQAKGNPVDHQPPHTGKLANDHNKMGNKAPTQANEGKRTPESRHDRQTMSGGPMNVIQARTGGKGGGRGPRGGGTVGGGAG